MRFNSYNSLCDDFCFDMHINTELDLPGSRDTVLTFFERLGKQFPALGNFYRRDTGDFCLEEERHDRKYRWVTLELDRICCGCDNPSDLNDGYELSRATLQLIPYMLGVTRLDIDSLDVTYTMDFDCEGNHDEIISEAMFGQTAFNCLLDLPETRAIGFSPAVTIALTKDCRTQARISIESRTTVYAVRNEKYKADEPISLYFTIRRYPKPDEPFELVESFDAQCALAEELMAEKIIPNFVNPLTSVITQKRL